MRSHHPFLLYGGLGVVLTVACGYTLRMLAPTSYGTPAELANPSSIGGFLCLALAIMLAVPAVTGLLAARSTGFASYGGMVGAVSYVGAGFLQDLVDPSVANALNTLWPYAVLLLGCQAVLGFVAGALGGLVGRQFYVPEQPGVWAPSPYPSDGGYGPRTYLDPPQFPGGVSGSSSSYYAPPYQPPPRYQPGGATPLPGYAQPPYPPSQYGSPPQGWEGPQWNQGRPAEGAGKQPGENAWGHPWQGGAAQRQ